MRNFLQELFSKGLLLVWCWVGLGWTSWPATAQDLLVSAASQDSVLRFRWPDGAALGAFVAPGSGGLSAPYGLRYGPDGDLYVASYSNHSIMQYGGATGAYIRTFVPSQSGGLICPWPVAWSGNGNLYTAGDVAGAPYGCECLRQYDGASGAYVGLGPCEFNGSYSARTHAIAFRRTDGNFFVAWSGLGPSNYAIAEYTAAGTRVRLIQLTDLCDGLAIGPDGYLYASQWVWDKIVRINPATGVISDFAWGGGLDAPEDLAFGPDPNDPGSNLFVCQWLTASGVREYDGRMGAFVRVFCSAPDAGLIGLTFMPAASGTLAVAPVAPFNSGGPQGGPFAPPSATYTLTNTGGSAIDFTADDDVFWLTTAPPSGTLAPGASVPVTVTITPEANGLPPPGAFGLVTFTNTTNGQGNTTRAVFLNIFPPGLEFFMGLGDLGGGAVSSTAWGISADGATIGGFSASGAGEQAFRWSDVAWLNPLPGGIAPDPSRGRRVSGDGTVIVGSWNVGAAAREACYWAGLAPPFPLGDLPGGPFFSEAFGVSDDGAVVVGYGTTAVGEQAFWWTAAGGMAPLLPVAPPGSRAYAVSGDGMLAVGYVDTPPTRQASAWPAGGGFIPLGDVPAGIGYNEGHELSTDGSYVVGYADTIPPGGDFVGDVAFRWTAATGMVPLGFLPGLTDSRAWDISADSTLVVGVSYVGGGAVAEPFIWDPTRGMRALVAEVAGYGVAVPPGWTLFAAMGIAVNGPIVTIAGNGLDPAGQPTGWVVRYSRAGDLNCDGVVNFGDINPFVLALSEPAGYAAQYPSCNIQNGDINGDGRVDFDDINPFVAILTNP